MDAVWAFLGPLLYLTLLTGTFIYLFKKRFNFQFLLPIALIVATLLVFFLTFITHRITVGIVITVIGALAFIPLLIRDKERGELLRGLLFTPAYLIFVALYAVIFVLHYNFIPQIFSDDLMHWAPHVWTMWIRDDFYTSPGLSIVTHGDYQPILQLFQLMFVKVAGMYREELLYVALEITCFAMLFPLLTDMTWRKKKTVMTLVFSLLILIALLVLPTLIDVTHLFYNALHPDYAIAFVFILGGFLAIRQSKTFDWTGAILLSLVVTFLCLTKQSSILFGGIVGLVYVTGTWLAYKKPKYRELLHRLRKFLKRGRRSVLLCIAAIVLLVLPLVALKLWQTQIKGFKAPYCCVAIFHIGASDALKVPGVLLGDAGNESQQTYARSFVRYVTTYQVGLTPQILSGITYAQFILLTVGIVAFLGYNYKDKHRRTRFLAFAAIVIAGWFLYCFAIYLTFLFGGMIDSERNNLLVGDRYLRTYIFAIFMALFGLLITSLIAAFNQRKSSGRAVLTLAIIVIGTLGFLFNIDLVKNHQLYEGSKFKDEYAAQGIPDPREFSSRLRRFTVSLGGTFEAPKHVAVTELPGRQTAYLLRYLLLPNKLENGSDLMFDDAMTQEKTCSILRNNDYLYIKHAYDDERTLAMINGCITNTIDSLRTGQAFAIEKDGGSLRLVDWRY